MVTPEVHRGSPLPPPRRQLWPLDRGTSPPGFRSPELGPAAFTTSAPGAVHAPASDSSTTRGGRGAEPGAVPGRGWAAGQRVTRGDVTAAAPRRLCPRAVSGKARCEETASALGGLPDKWSALWRCPLSPRGQVRVHGPHVDRGDWSRSAEAHGQN